MALLGGMVQRCATSSILSVDFCTMLGKERGRKKEKEGGIKTNRGRDTDRQGEGRQTDINLQTLTSIGISATTGMDTV